MKRLILIIIALLILVLLSACGDSLTEEESPEVPEAPLVDTAPPPDNLPVKEPTPVETSEVSIATPLLTENITTPKDIPPEEPVTKPKSEQLEPVQKSDNATSPDELPEETPDSIQSEEDKAEEWIDNLPSTDLVFTPHGLMVIYYGEKIPVSIYVPGMMKEDYSDMWIKSNNTGEIPSYPLFQRHSENFTSQLTITEPSFEELELPEMTLEDYTNYIINTNKTLITDFEFISTIKRQHLYNYNMTVAILEFSGEKGKRIYNRLIYIHENGYIFNITYVYEPAIDDITEMIKYSFDSLQLVQGN